ncbi:hypothetical protein Taro_048476 [Colocasia esculenta]|uniref:Uncharacterized protein n=1 Tax=Colocasia esculenta TaxID=4460 RepID=A0A843X883_COLES|nr:hypothetical protein [Colocasia esculenta]
MQSITESIPTSARVADSSRKKRNGRVHIAAPLPILPTRTMTAVLHSPSNLPSSPSSSFSCTSNDEPRQIRNLLTPDPPTEVDGGSREEGLSSSAGKKSSQRRRREEDRRKREQEEQLSLLALLLDVGKSLIGCRTEDDEDSRSMEIGWPTNVRHVAHVTFDRFHGFLGLPVEFEPEVPRRSPSASASVFGVSTDSMQCSYDSRRNSVPTILLLMQRRLYEQGGLQAEGIFRINAENSQEELVRDQLNGGIVPDGVDVHCLAGLIKAWFRELPTGVLDPLTPEQVMQCKTEQECAQLVKLLPPTEAALLDWAINLMADVVQEEHHNKMNARNVAMVFAPNMTQMADPLTALMYAVQVMNFLKTLILKALRDRQEPVLDTASASPLEPSDENGHQCPCLPLDSVDGEETDCVFVSDEPCLENPSHLSENNSTFYDYPDSSQNSSEKAPSEGTGHSGGEQPCEAATNADSSTSGLDASPADSKPQVQLNSCRTRGGKTGMNSKKGARKASGQSAGRVSASAEKARGGASIVSRINSRVERVEAWR